MSATATAIQAQKIDLLNQLPQVIADKTTRNLHDSECAIARLSNVANTQNVGIQLLKFLTQLEGLWRLEVWWKWIAVGHRRGKKRENGGDILRRSI